MWDMILNINDCASIMDVTSTWCVMQSIPKDINITGRIKGFLKENYNNMRTVN